MKGVRTEHLHHYRPLLHWEVSIACIPYHTFKHIDTVGPIEPNSFHLCLLKIHDICTISSVLSSQYFDAEATVGSAVASGSFAAAATQGKATQDCASARRFPFVVIGSSTWIL